MADVGADTVTLGVGVVVGVGVPHGFAVASWLVCLTVLAPVTFVFVLDKAVVVGCS